MSRARLLINGVLMNWTAFAFAVITSFFISPFVVHHLGNVLYGVWVLVNSSISYMALFDLGMRGTITHFIAKHHGREEHIESSRALSVALGFRVLISLTVVIGTFTLAAVVNRIFRIPPNMQETAQVAVLITGCNLSFTLLIGVFGGVLVALQRFDLSSGLAIIQTLLSAVGTISILNHGYGIVALAIMQLVVTLWLGVVTIVLCFKIYPELRISTRYFDKSSFTALWAYSFYLFILSITSQVVYYTDNIVVGAFISAEAVAFYAIGGRFVEYLRQLGSSLAQTFMPTASSLAALDKTDDLRRLLIQGTRAALFVSLPIGWTLFFRGSTLIGLWMRSPQYAQTSGRILRILLLATIPLAGNLVAANIVFGLGKHKRFAQWQCCEAVANLALSIYLVRRIGIDGVAWGTVLPSLVSQLILWPRYISKLLELSVWRYFLEGWVRPALATLPFGLACIWMSQYWATHSMLQLVLQIAVTLPLVPTGIILFFWKETSWQLRNADSLLRRTLLIKLRPNAIT